MRLVRAAFGLFRRNPALARLLAGEFVSGIGDWLYLVAMLVVVYAATESAVLLGIMGAARVIPYVVLSVPAGIVADRFDRRLVLLVTDVARGVLMLLLTVVVLVEGPVLLVIALAVLATCFSTFFGPAISALLPALVDERELGPANSAWATLDNLAYIIGPAIAGLLIAAGGLALAFLLNAASFAVVAVVLWSLPVPRRNAPAPAEARGSTGARLEAEDRPAGWRRLIRPLAGPFVLDSLTSFLAGGLGVLTVILAIAVLEAGAAGTGYLNAATGVGGVLAGVAGGVLLARQLRTPLVVGGLAGGAGLAWLGLAGDLVTASIAIGVAVGGTLLLDIVNTTLIQRIVPDELRGRAMGIIQSSSAVFYAAGSLVLPLLAVGVGVPATLIGAGIGVVAAVAVAILLSGPGVAATPLDALRAHVFELPVFAGLPAPRLEAAARAMEIQPVRAGDVVVRQGERADRFYVIGDGRFTVTQAPGTGQPPIVLRELGAGDVFGEVGLLRRSPRTASVTAASDGTLLALEGADFLNLVSAGPGLSTRLLDLYRGALSR